MSVRGHLPPERIVAESLDLEEEERAHLGACVVCRLDRQRIWRSALDTTSLDTDRARVIRHREDPELSIGENVGPYVVDAILGRGGMAWVYRVWHRELQAPRALKVLRVPSPEHLARLLLEGNLQARLSHPHIATVFDVQMVRERPALVLEYIEGSDLAKRLRDPPPLQLRQIEAIAAGVLLGVEAAHNSGVIHRDLKPQNVLLAGDADGIVAKVSDFGLARVIDAIDPSDPSWTGSSRIMGTPAYMAPEQHRSARDVDHRADIFSLGAILYEMLAGRPAFRGSSLEEIRSLVLSGRRPSLRELPAEIPDRMLRAIDAALQLDPAVRPQSCEQLRAIWEGQSQKASFGKLTRVKTIVSIEQPSLRRDNPARDTLSDEAWALHERSVRELLRRFGGRSLSRGEDQWMLMLSGLESALGFIDSYRAVARRLAEGLRVSWEPRIAVVTGLVASREPNADVGSPADAEGDPIDIASVLVRIAPPKVHLYVGEAPKIGGISSYGTYQVVGLRQPVEIFGRGEPIPDHADFWRVSMDGSSWKPLRQVRARLAEAPEALFGREELLAKIESAFASGDRAVVLSGPAGVGKSAIALAFARSRLGWWPGGAYRCALGAVASAEVMSCEVLDALGVALGDGDPVVVAGLMLQWSEPCLLLLDGIDALDAESIAVLGAWIEHAPRARFLFTSRSAPPSIPGSEIVVGTHPQPLSPLESLPAALECPAIRQLTEQIASTRPDFRVQRHDLPSIVRIVRLLGGSPRAIALAAGSARSDELPDLYQQLSSFSGGCDALQAEQSSEIVLSWCWGLLTEAPRAILVHCSVFEGPFSTEAAERISVLPAGAQRSIRLELETLAMRRLVERVGGGWALLSDARSYAIRWAEDRCPLELREARTRLATYCSGSPSARIGDRISSTRHALSEGNTFLAISACLSVGAILRGGRAPALLAERVLALPGLTDIARAELLSLRARHRSVVAGLERARYDVSSVPFVFGEARSHARARLDRERRAAAESVSALREATTCFEAARNDLAAAHTTLAIGDLQRALRDTSAARESYERALARYRRCGSRSDLLQASRRLASLVFSEKSPAQARPDLEQALAAAKSSGDPSLEADLHADLGSCGCDVLSQEHLRESARISKRTGDLRGEARALLALGDALGALEASCAAGDGDGAVRALRALQHDTERASGEAILAYERAIAELRETSRPMSLLPTRALSASAPGRGSGVQSLIARGRRHRLRGRNEEALSCFSAALDAAKHSSVRLSEGVALREMAAIHRSRGHLDAAIGCLAASLSPGCGGGLERQIRQSLASLVCQRSGSSEIDALLSELKRHQTRRERAYEARKHVQIGRLHQERGNHEEAARHLAQAIERFHAVGEHAHEAGALAALARSERYFGEDERPVEHLDAALSLYRSAGDLRGEATTLVALAEIHADEERWTLAIGLYLSGLARCKQTGRHAEEALAHARLGDTLRRQGRLGEAYAQIEIAEKKLGENNPIGEAIWQGFFGALLASRGSFDGARRAFDRAAELLYLQPCPPRFAEVLALRAEAHRERDPADALAAIDEIRYIRPQPGAPLLRKISVIRAQIEL